ncbi:hypothetical protein COUCH_27580 [Couchioplanes caeruleus]|uniref:hypothetical protein n=1 Tax=Couchioplanes caeruleus TaxID=56438 RepID=UPI0020C11BB4|nr:hypothetical protein [Couchioplanes caeruleus]UQU62778.1 hypothetical protein COUCH_27580 [Couchioplanes caeruleus]
MAYGMLIAAATLGLSRIPIALVGALAAVAGACGPLLTGGLSSRLAALPAGGDTVPPDEVLSVRQALRLIVTTGPLRRVMYTTVVAAVPGGAVAVIAVAYGPDLHVDAGTAGLLAAAFGLGNLLGSLAVSARPLLGEPEKLVTRTAAVVGLGFALCAAAPGYPLAFAGFALVRAAGDRLGHDPGDRGRHGARPPGPPRRAARLAAIGGGCHERQPRPATQPR